MIPTQFGKYRIIQWLGGGTFGDVYLAEDTLLDKSFALKVARTRDKELAILKREARILSDLLHSNVVRFYSIDIIDEHLVLVMEYVNGYSLRTLLEKKSIGRKEALRITQEILEGLDYAHRKGVIHRDIKPENILLQEPEKKVKLTDFGLGALFKGTLLSMSVAGTPIYLAPEGWKGQFLPQTDLFAVGCILYEMLTGRPPFSSDNLDTLRNKIRKGNFPHLTGSYPSNLKKIISKCLKPDYSQRYSSANQVLKEMDKMAEEGVLPVKATETIKMRERDILSALTPEQRSAVERTEGYILVWGGAGCGKTQTLGHRVAYLIKEKGVNPDEILCVTFTGKALLDLKQRIEKLIPKKDAIRMHIGTFHSIGIQILSVGADRLDFPKEEFKIVQRQEQMKILKNATRGLGQEQRRAILQDIELSKANLITPEEMFRRATSNWHKYCSEVYLSYQHSLLKQRAMDYDDIIFYAVRLLRDFDDIRERFSKRYRYILVDEFQDVNKAQVELLKHLSSHYGNLWVTGDENQAIYGFRGASTEWMENFSEIFTSAIEMSLTRSFRLPEEISEMAQKVSNMGRKDKGSRVYVSPKKKEKPVIIYRAENEKEEALYVCREVKELISRSKSESDIAVLFRTGSKGRKVEETFAKNTIPYNVTGRSSFYTRREIRALVNYLEFLRTKKKKFLIAGLKKFLIKETKNLTTLRDLLLKKKKVQDPYLRKVQETIQRHKKHWKELRPEEVINEFLEATNYLSFLIETGTSSTLEEEENIRDFINMAREFQPGEVKPFVDSLSLIQFLERDKREEGITLSTVHSAKGLEFSYVFVVGLVEGGFPLMRVLSSERELREERRLFYVALTRAKERVYLTYPERLFSKPTHPSRFIEDMFL